jgi:methylase of polypeptide subunit release factors
MSPSGLRSLETNYRRIAERRAGRSEATLAADIRGLLLSGYLDLDADDLQEVELEAAVGGGRRIDIEVGYTVIEVKKDLRAADTKAKAVEQLAGYVRDRSAAFGQRYVGVLTDGAEWTLYHLRPGGDLEAASTFTANPSTPDPEGLALWLEGALVSRHNIPPVPEEIEKRLGADSTGHRLDYTELLALYETNRGLPSVELKRGLWSRLLTTAFGTGFSDDEQLFVDHTLLVVMSEVIAHAVIGFDVAALDPRDLVTGGRFEEAQIGGVVEEDFFDWVMEVDGGEEFVRALARRLAAFDWQNVEHDVMKVLYESVISAEQRHDLGEYYTPDWLAEPMIEHLLMQPLDVRVLDPACGSGTFVFHGVRRYLAKADEAGHAVADATSAVTAHVMGVDVHPVAVTLARVTYLLALGRERLQHPDRPPLSIPIYLGDSLQWERDEDLLTSGTLTIRTDEGLQLFANELRFPEALLEDAAEFDRLVAELSDRATQREPGSAHPNLTATFRRFGVSTSGDQATIQATFDAMCELHDRGEDHIWGYYVRNLARPVWLAANDNHVDVLVGNPPWLSYRYMPAKMQKTFREMSQERDVWAGGGLATHQDLSALFVARSVELYLKEGGTFGFVMPRAVLDRQQFAGFRAADFLASVKAAFERDVWDLDDVEPSPFPVPSCVVFGTRSRKPLPLSGDREVWKGGLPLRNISWSQARTALSRTQIAGASGGGKLSPYATEFAQGATLTPRFLVTVEDAPAGPLGAGAGRRAVTSARTSQEKQPWKDLPSLKGAVETEFVRPVLFGVSVAPFRVIGGGLSIVPWEGDHLLDGEDDGLDDHPGLAKWWRQAEDVWNSNRRNDKLSLRERLDYQRGLSRQFPIPPQRVVYTKAGTNLAAARVEDTTAVIDHKLYWAPVKRKDEAQYLVAVMNSGEVKARVNPLQSRGQWGERDIDKYVFQVSFPKYDASDADHVALAKLGDQAETVAASVPAGGVSYSVVRRRIRNELAKSGVSAAIDKAVRALLT